MISDNNRRYHLWAAIAILFYFSLYLFLGLSRHWSNLTSINDLGVADQAVWGTLHGDFFLNTSQFNQPIAWLGVHFHLIYLLDNELLHATIL